MSQRAVIGLGSNLHNPLQQVEQALVELAGLADSELVQVSSFYHSAPMGPADQPDYINAVAELRTALAPHALLDALQAIEQQHGRVRKAERWGPRSLDLDILLYGDELINNARLQVPHPGMKDRAFVLYPLLEILPDCDIPGLGKLSRLVSHCPADDISRLEAGS